MKKNQIRQEISKLGQMFQAGQWAQLFKRATQDARKWPREAAFPRMAGLAAAQQGQARIARTWFERAWRMMPDDRDIQQNYALSLVQTGDTDTALSLIDQIAAKGPLVPGMLHLKALILFGQKHPRQAWIALEQALAQDPNHIESNMLAVEVLDELRNPDQALDLLTAVVRRHPKFPVARLRLAKLLTSMGRLDDALDHARAALAANPGDGETLRFMSGLSNLLPPDVDHLRKTIDEALNHVTRMTPKDVALVQFAAANMARREGDISTEMAHLDQAHAQAKAALADAQDQIDRPDQRQAALRETLDQDLPAPHPRGCTNQPTPIFIVGLPRSGTTLVERILSAHSAVQGFGELTSVMHWAATQKPTTTPADAAENLAGFYQDHLPDLAEGTAAYVDKMPGNYAHLGDIARAFPNARIIDVNRDPRDTALSMWREYFGAEGMFYTHDLEWLAAEANRYRAYMRHWDRLLPGRIHHMRYEDLVTGFATQARALAEFCGLRFQDAMLHPHLTPGAVRTAAQLQVRQPVHAGSIGTWRAASAHLTGFIDALDRDLWPDLAPQQGVA